MSCSACPPQSCHSVIPAPFVDWRRHAYPFRQHDLARWGRRLQPWVGGQRPRLLLPGAPRHGRLAGARARRDICSTAVVQGTVVATSVHNSVWGVRTAVRLRVGRSLKGPAESSMTVYVPGGELPDGTRVVVDGMASFRVGDTCFVFVDTRGWVIGGFQGKLGVTYGRVRATGETTASLGRRVTAAIGAAPPVPPSSTPTAARRAPALPTTASTSSPGSTACQTA